MNESDVIIVVIAFVGMGIIACLVMMAIRCPICERCERQFDIPAYLRSRAVEMSSSGFSTMGDIKDASSSSTVEDRSDTDGSHSSTIDRVHPIGMATPPSLPPLLV